MAKALLSNSVATHPVQLANSYATLTALGISDVSAEGKLVLGVSVGITPGDDVQRRTTTPPSWPRTAERPVRPAGWPRRRSPPTTRSAPTSSTPACAPTCATTGWPCDPGAWPCVPPRGG